MWTVVLVGVWVATLTAVGVLELVVAVVVAVPLAALATATRRVLDAPARLPAGWWRWALRLPGAVVADAARLTVATVRAIATRTPLGCERTLALPRPPTSGPDGRATRLAGWALLPVTLLVGADIVLHGHLTPGGGFQGGVVLATAIHLLYLAGSFPTLQWLRPTRRAPLLEPAGSGLFVVTGVAGLLTGAGFLANVLPLGVLGAPLSSGTVLALNVVAGVGVGAAVVSLLGQFLRQELVISTEEAS